MVHLRDVTDQMALQRSIRGFHTLVSHKLRTPLAGILGGLEILENSGDTLPRDKIVEFSKLALENAERLHNELRDIFDYLDTSGSAQSRARFSLAQLQPLVAEISADLEIEAVTIASPAG